MTKFRKKPIIIDAVQWFPDVEIDGVTMQDSGVYATIVTLEGIMRVDWGDWVITGVKGEKYPCKPDIFELTYESMPAQPQDRGDDGHD